MNQRKNTSRRDFLRGRPISGQSEQSEDLVDSPTLTPRQRLQCEYLQHFSKRAMACDFEIFLNLNQYDQAAEATLDAFELIDDLDRQLSVYQPESEVSRLNASGDSLVAVSDTLRKLLQMSETLHRETGGAFDISSTPLSRVWGFFGRQGAVPNPVDLEDASGKVDASRIQLLPEGVRFLLPEMEVNFNSIGKGYALDRAAFQMVAFGVRDLVIHGGQSSVIARGNEIVPESFQKDQEEDGGWKVGLSHPFVPNHRLAEITLRNQSLGTSGTARQGFFHEGRRYGHVLDPRTGWPTDHFLSTTVISNSAAQSDALATSFFVMSEEEVRSYCQDHPEVTAILVVPQKRAGQVDVVVLNDSKNSVKLFD